MTAVDRTIRDYRDGRMAFDQPEVGRLVKEIENLRLKVADYEAVYGGAAITKSEKA